MMVSTLQYRLEGGGLAGSKCSDRRFGLADKALVAHSLRCHEDRMNCLEIVNSKPNRLYMFCSVEGFRLFHC